MTRGETHDGRAGRHLRLGLAAVAFVLVGGTLGLELIERLPWLEALYDTLGLMTTSGGFDRPVTAAGRVLAIAILITGVGSLFYSLGAVAEYLIEGHLSRTIGRHRMDRKLERLRGHAIICGYGRVGRRIAREFVDAGDPFVVIDPREENIRALEEAGHLCVRGDATTDDALLEAGVRRAHSLLAATDADTENIAITLSARALAPDLWIIARANHDETARKLRRAGADRVLSPYALGGHRMAGLARRPHLVDFLDTAMEEGELELALEEIDVPAGSPLVGLRLPDGASAPPARLGGRTILAVRPAGTARWILAPRRVGTTIAAGDCLILLGPMSRAAPPDAPPDGGAADASAGEATAPADVPGGADAGSYHFP